MATLTAEQKAKLKKILDDHRRDVHAIVNKHKADVMKAIDTIEKRKMAKIEEMIKKS